MKRLLSLFTILQILAFAQPGSASTVIHRAFEPARATLDVNLNDTTLTLFVSLSPEAISEIAPGRSIDELVQKLSEQKQLVTPNPAADCQLNGQQFTEQSVTSLTGHSAAEINGYLAFECSEPDRLKTVTSGLMDIFPRLVEISVWLVTDRWQDKQRLTRSQPIIRIKAR